jgi:phosphatidylglycerophosphatase A
MTTDNEPGPEQQRTSWLATVLATWFGVGLIPIASGTWGSLAALPFAWVLLDFGGWQWLLGAGVIATLVGIWATGRYAEDRDLKDPSPCVIDEVAGQWITLVPAALDPVHFAIGFFAFRLFDIWKPWPARWADRDLDGGVGIMLDDVFAGIYAAGVLVLARYFWLG